ncbi:MAG TPA: Glu/Leu/Phe/Val dehydrogenase dimerization domain-containing protein [Anaerolineae bacterium]|jgi:leucine dehydrogenase|nr:Glu/Leu/Phe/Val dehydrogenase dimerization domain-containing protein [Anaerolineae bacterium]
MIESLLSSWNGQSVVVHNDKPTGAVIIIAIHSSRLGPATGGTRMKPYANLGEAFEDAFRLSAGMTYKFAVPDLDRGGGKAVIVVPQDLAAQDRPDLLRRYGALIHQLGGLFYTGPDVGTTAADMDVIAETGHPYIFCRSPECGGGGSPGPYTALGVFTAIQVANARVSSGTSLAGCRVLVQGVGSVGRRLIDHLMAAGVEVLFSEVDEAIISQCRDELGLKFVPAQLIASVDCDIYAPCALGGVLNEDTIPQLKCRAVAGGANNQLSTPEAAEQLMARGILYAPDYVVNVGGAMAICGIELQGWSPGEAQKRVSDSVREALSRIFHLSQDERITTDAAARRIAEGNLARARPKDMAPIG